ncbi:hypothetical protein M409DRAFT_56770 [Zasmidium cellare ATCC 36951]|uniref:DUF7730 domain-containing protein n=1 Tax=Zasmidium cellare ATCC 36951 TaxID=1080233 RepID=A0A6A6CGG6_ZASCE|nr:uncharacterized protein M409DRAFT_56770 [Zasmidium cellare ATCC 36951]KAF2164516.1 hypothetical protein M409DRAFT_56770 [Zasmidium cellare ATCC 36951]
MVSARRTRIHKPEHNPHKKNAHSIRQRIERSRERRVYKELQGEDMVIGVAVPESTCECCENKSAPVAKTTEMEFDANGFPFVKKSFYGTSLSHWAHLPGPPPKRYNSVPPPDWTSEAEYKPFPFLKLPAELRNRIYELVVKQETQPVCVNDNLLRPSTDMPDLNDVLHTCTADLVCAPCQIHEALGTGSLALSSACVQLHSETLPITYKVNHFSVHNLYYLQAFLTIIGDAGRKSVKSLRFDWKLPEDESHALDTFADSPTAYMLLLQCKQLTTLWIDLDVVNLLSWGEDGERNGVVKRDMSETRGIALMYSLRGLEEIRVRWKNVEGLVMEDWVKAMMGVWRLPHGAQASQYTPVEAEVTLENKEEWRCVFWKKKGECPSIPKSHHSTNRRNPYTAAWTDEERWE